MINSISVPTRHFSTRELAIRRAFVAALAFLAIFFFTQGAPILRQQILTPCDGPACQEWQRPIGMRGVSPEFAATMYVAREGAFLLVSIVVAAIIMWRAAHDRTAWLGAISLICLSSATSSDTIVALGRSSLHWRIPVEGMSLAGALCFFVFFYIFPDGRLLPRWTRWALPIWITVVVVSYLVPYKSPLHYYGDGFLLLFVAYVGSSLVAQVQRYRHISTPVQRQQTKWVMIGLGSSIVGFFVSVFLFPAIGPDIIPDRVAFATFGGWFASVSLILIPISIGLAMIRYRLWDVDILINRALVYGALTTLVIGLYFAIVSIVGAFTTSSSATAGSITATALVALGANPLRGRLQRAVNGLLYGERDTPYVVLSRLAQRLGDTMNQTGILPTIVGTVTEALKLPYAAIALWEGDSLIVAASHGTATNDVVRWPLRYHQDILGELRLAPRSRGEEFSAADRRLINDLSQQAGIAVHAIQLTLDLQRSRERLITTREEERRRLRRDLHDGLGPQLASQVLILDAARRLQRDDPLKADALLYELRTQTETAIADIRTLIYDLRPPSLDDLGLVAALRERAQRFHNINLRIEIDGSSRLPDLPAAVEVAAYWIVLEALTNAVRHANATSCTVSISLAAQQDAPYLEISVIDNGRGLPAVVTRGVGLDSMRERAEEVGGTCTISNSPLVGTTINARFPLLERA